MELRGGIPLISDVDAMKRNEAFARHVEFNREFISRHAGALRGYGKHWGEDPLKLWSRRWEYPFCERKVAAYANEKGLGAAGQPGLRILDAGSGVTYFPYLVCSELPGAQVVCCDSNAAYVGMFDAINRGEQKARVTFKTAMLQELPLETGSMDVVCCISVLEHTDNYRAILGEFGRVLKAGGVLVLTFDLSLDGKFKLSRREAEDLLAAIGEKFEVGWDARGELARMDNREGILSTDYVRKTEPELLPWRYPKLMAMRDLLGGKGWTGGFRSKSVFCMEARSPQGARV